MPTILSHAAVPIAIGLGLGTKIVPPRLLLVGIIASMIPDLDVIGFRFNVPYASSFGHRGASHSLSFAVLLALMVSMLSHRLKSSFRATIVFVSLCTASHGLLDMCTNGGLGVALWWPVGHDRFFASCRFIEVSPIGHRFFSRAAGKVLWSELVWIWIPATVLFCCLAIVRRSARLPRA
jgi:inner membrane protein